jgi:hypothetical protein
VNAAFNTVLGLDFAFFVGVKQQLSTLLEVWNLVLEEKASFDAYGTDPTMSCECQEALLLAGKIIAARAFSQYRVCGGDSGVLLVIVG